MGQWLVLIARDRPEQWVSWTCFYGGGGNVEVLWDRRQGLLGPGWGDHPDRRARATRETILQDRGFLVLPRPDLVGVAR